MTKKVCIIGAGAAGLAALHHVNSSPCDLVGTVFEQTSYIGGVWHYTDDFGANVHSAMYRNLSTNLPKEIMGFLDYPFIKGRNSYVTHQEVLEYLHDFADHFNLWENIQFNTRVQRVKPTFRDDEKKKMEDSDEEREKICPEKLTSSPAKWLVTVQHMNSGIRETFEFDSVIICNGHYFEPFIPLIPNLNQFQGKVMHSKDYRCPDSFKGQRVVVVGSGPSGIDISLEISTVAAQVILSLRNPPYSSQLPPTIKQVPPIKFATPSGFVFKDGQQTTQCDVLLLCSGYKYSFPFLDPTCGIQVVNDGKYIKSLFKHMIYPKTKLCFIGIPVHCIPFYMFDIQIRYFVKVLEGKIKLPSEPRMLKEILEDERQRQKLGICDKLTHQLGDLQWEYYLELARAGHFESELKPVVRKIFDETTERRFKHATVFKADVVTIIDDSTCTYDYAQPNL